MNQDIVQVLKMVKDIGINTVDIISRGEYISAIYNLVFVSIVWACLCYLTYYIFKNRDRLDDKFGDAFKLLGTIECIVIFGYTIFYFLYIPNAITCISNPEYCAIKTLIPYTNRSNN